MTNADKIRQMSDDELANMFAMYEARSYGRVGYKSNEEQFAKQWLDWLKQEVEE